MSLCPHQDLTSIQSCSLPLNIITSSSCTKCPCSPPHSSDQMESRQFFLAYRSNCLLILLGFLMAVTTRWKMCLLLTVSSSCSITSPPYFHACSCCTRIKDTSQHLHLCPMCSQSVLSSPLDRSTPKATRVSICPQQVSRVWTPVLSCGHTLFGGNTMTKLSLQ